MRKQYLEHIIIKGPEDARKLLNRGAGRWIKMIIGIL
jgi:hypothetical protein